MELDWVEAAERRAWSATSEREQLITQVEQLVKNLRKIHRNVSEVEVRNAVLEGDINQYREDEERAKRKIDELSSENEIFRGQLNEKTENEKQLLYNVAELHEGIAVSEMSKLQLQARIAELEQENEKLERQWQQANDDYEGLSAITNLRIDELNTDLGTFKDHNEELTREVKRLRLEMQAAEDEYQSERTECRESFDAMVERSNAELAQARAEIDRLKRESNEEVDRLKRENETLRTEAEGGEDQLREREQEIERLKAQVMELQEHIVSFSAEPPTSAIQAELRALKERYNILMTVLQQRVGVHDDMEVVLNHSWNYLARVDVTKRLETERQQRAQAEKLAQELQAEVQRLQMETCSRDKLRQSEERCQTQAMEIARLKEQHRRELIETKRAAEREAREKYAPEAEVSLTHFDNTMAMPWTRSPTY